MDSQRTNQDMRFLPQEEMEGTTEYFSLGLDAQYGQNFMLANTQAESPMDAMNHHPTSLDNSMTAQLQMQAIHIAQQQQQQQQQFPANPSPESMNMLYHSQMALQTGMAMPASSGMMPGQATYAGTIMPGSYGSQPAVSPPVAATYGVPTMPATAFYTSDTNSVLVPMNQDPYQVGSGNPLTDFTKRRGWAQRLLADVPCLYYVLDQDAKFQYISTSSKAMVGYTAEEIIGKTISDFIHADDWGEYWSKFNKCIQQSNQYPFRMFMRFRHRNGDYQIFETIGHAHYNNQTARPHPECSGMFMSSRPYPSRNAALLDTFLEHRIEYDRLSRRLYHLKQEEEEDNYGTNSQSHPPSEPGELVGSIDQPFSSRISDMTGSPLTKQNLEARFVENMQDKMDRYEGTSRASVIEMSTGLRLMDGEISRGLSTGNASPTLIRGDAGVPIPLDTQNRNSGDKKKRQKTSESEGNHICRDCGSFESPEWRKGPEGPKTLCNACGLRWAKERKRQLEAEARGGEVSPGTRVQ